MDENNLFSLIFDDNRKKRRKSKGARRYSREKNMKVTPDGDGIITPPVMRRESKLSMWGTDKTKAENLRHIEECHRISRKVDSGVDPHYSDVSSVAGIDNQRNTHRELRDREVTGRWSSLPTTGYDTIEPCSRTQHRLKGLVGNPSPQGLGCRGRDLHSRFRMDGKEDTNMAKGRSSVIGFEDEGRPSHSISRVASELSTIQRAVRRIVISPASKSYEDQETLTCGQTESRDDVIESEYPLEPPKDAKTIDGIHRLTKDMESSAASRPFAEEPAGLSCFGCICF